jgi:hypothetical protein
MPKEMQESFYIKGPKKGSIVVPFSPVFHFHLLCGKARWEQKAADRLDREGFVLSIFFYRRENIEGNSQR